MEDEEGKFTLEEKGLCNIYFNRKSRFSFVYAGHYSDIHPAVK